MKTRIIFFIYLMACSAVAVANYGFFTGEQLRTMAKNYQALELDPDNYNHEMLSPGLFIGYVAGKAESLAEIKKLCMNNGSTAQQIGHIVAQFIDRSPQFWRLHASAQVEMALTTAFPCHK